MLPDYLMEKSDNLVQLIPVADIPSLDTYFTYPSELRNSKRVGVLRDFLIDEAQRWRF